MQSCGGTIVDATIVDAPSRTENQYGERDGEMHQIKTGNEWYFGMKGHLGVDSSLKLIHSVVATPAKTVDGRVVNELLHGEKTRVWGDRDYDGQHEPIAAPATGTPALHP